jgi:hypothetical protein
MLQALSMLHCTSIIVISYYTPAPRRGRGINSCWEKCDEKCAYMFKVYKNQLSRQTGSRNLTGPKTLPTIWYTYKKTCYNGIQMLQALSMLHCTSIIVISYYTPAPRRGRGVYCFISVRLSVLLSVQDI